MFHEHFVGVSIGKKSPKPIVMFEQTVDDSELLSVSEGGGHC
jgi:hypothetical protein